MGGELENDARCGKLILEETKDDGQAALKKDELKQLFYALRWFACFV
jgi:hypothetical protein